MPVPCRFCCTNVLTSGLGKYIKICFEPNKAMQLGSYLPFFLTAPDPPFLPIPFSHLRIEVGLSSASALSSASKLALQWEKPLWQEYVRVLLSTICVLSFMRIYTHERIKEMTTVSLFPMTINDSISLPTTSIPAV